MKDVRKRCQLIDNPSQLLCRNGKLMNVIVIKMIENPSKLVDIAFLGTLKNDRHSGFYSNLQE